MKQILIFFLFITSLSYSQVWQTLADLDEFGGGGTITRDYQYNTPFSIDPYSNSLWFGGYIELYHIDGAGNKSHWNFQTNHTIFQQGGGTFIRDFSFSSNTTYLVTDPMGLFSYDGSSFAVMYNGINAKKSMVDNDTVYLSRGGDPSITYVNDIFNTTFPVNSSRLIKRNHIIWNSTTYYFVNNVINGIQKYNNADTIPFLLSNYNYDMKFKHNSDTMYVASELGFSKTFDTLFVDTLTPFNSNMPHPKVREFEFDKNDNMWAVFADDNDEAFALGFYDGTTWSKYYDASNSPIDWPNFTGVEIDTFNNVWISDEYALHTLKEYQVMDWLELGITENSTAIELSIFPNPSLDGTFQINTKATFEKLEVYTLDGKFVKSIVNSSSFNLSERGVYLIRVMAEDGSVLGTQRVVRV